MVFNIIKKFWFQAVALLSVIFMLCLWALNPISNEDLLNSQKNNIKNITSIYETLISDKINNLNKELFYFIDELKSADKNIIDNIETPIKAVFELENKNGQLSLSGSELRNVELSYWNEEDINKEINRNFNIDREYIENELVAVQAPNGDNFFGTLISKDEKFYFCLLNLHFASSWANQLNSSDSTITMINTFGDIIYHSELQYIGSPYAYFENVDFNSADSTYRVSREEIYFSKKIESLSMMVVVSEAKWAKPFGYQFYFKVIFCFLAILLLFYLIFDALFQSQKKKIKFNNSEFELDQSEVGKLKSTNRELVLKVKSLENEMAQANEIVNNYEDNKSLYEVKTKVAHLIGQIQLVKAVPTDSSVIEGIDFKLREVYKRVYQLLDNPTEKSLLNGPDNPPELREENIYDSGAANKIDYNIEDNIQLYNGSDRIEITENDIDGVDPNLMGEIQSEPLARKEVNLGVDFQSDNNFIEETELNDSVDSELKDAFEFLKADEVDPEIEKNISLQLEQQNYKQKPFSLEDDFLKDQRKQINKINRSNFSEQINKVDDLLSSIDQKLSKDKVKDIIRKPRVKGQ